MADYIESFPTDGALQSVAQDLTWEGVAGTNWEGTSGQASPGGTARGITGYARAEHDTDGSDQYGQFVVHAVTAGTDSQGGPCVRFQAGANTSYMAAVNANDGAPIVTIIKTVAGSRTNIGSPVAVDITGLPKVLRIEVSGDTLTAYWNGVQVAQETDTAIPSGTRGGLYGHEDSGQGLGFVIDNFEFGDLAARGDQTTSDPLPVEVGFAAPTVQAAYSTTAQPLTVAVDLATPAAAAAYSTAVEAFALDADLGTPTVSGGSQAAAGPLAMDVAFGTPAAAAAYSTTAEPLAIDLQFGPAVVAGGTPDGMVVGDLTGPERVTAPTPDGPALARTVTGPALRREVTGPAVCAVSVTGPERVADPTPDGPAVRREVTGPAVRRTVTGPEV